VGAGEYEILHHNVLSRVLEKFAPPASFLGAQIFKPEPVLAESVGIDIQIGARHMAPYRHPDAAAGLQALESIDHIDVTLPAMREKKLIPSSVLKVLRKPGTEHTNWGEAKLRRELRSLRTIIDKRREWARWQILTTGKLAYTGDIAFEVDFGISATHTPALSGTDKWDDYVNSDPIDDISGWKEIFAQDSDKQMMKAYVNSTTMNHMMHNAAIRALMGDDYKTQILKSGRITTLMDLEWEVYDLGYVPEGGSFTKFLSDGLVVFSAGDPFPEYEGLVSDEGDAENEPASKPGWFSKSWRAPDPSGRYVLVACNPLPSGERVEELFCADVF